MQQLVEASGFQQLFRDALEASPDCVKVVSRDDRLLFMNRNGCRLMDVGRPEDLLQRSWSELWPAAAQARVRAGLARAAQGGEDRFTAACPTAAGRPRHWDVNLSPLRDAAGAVAAVLVTSRDVTEQVAAQAQAAAREDELRRRTAALALAGELARIGGWEIDFRTGLVHWSAESCALLGGAPPVLPLDEAMRIYPDADRERVAAAFERARISSERLTFESEILRYDGTRGWARVFGRARLEDGVCVGLVGAAQDISDVMEVCAERERAERRHALAVELAELHVYELDYRRRLLLKSGSEDTFFEKPRAFADIVDDPFGSIDPRDRPRVRRAWEEAWAAGAPFRCEYRVNRSDGREVWAYAMAHLEVDPEGRPVRLVGAMRDVTARLTTQRELEAAKDRAEAASRAKSAFLANMSHEIRTPLNGVIGMAQVMEAGPLDPDQRERLKVVRRSGETLLAVLNDVLDLSKVEAGRMELDLQAFPLAECVHAAVDAFAVLAAQKDVAFDIDLAAAEGRWLGDPVRLRQVLGNLASNAVKFTAEGRVRVSVRPDPDGGLAFVVSDTGLGMDAETARTVFLPFVQADTSVTRRFGGTGLGLTICAELVRLMGGELRVESTPGAGSTFRFSLPLARAEAGDGAPAGGPAPPPPEVAGGELALRVLAAEDNPVNQLVIRSLLEPLGVELSVASDGAEAVARFKPGAFDLVLMDIQMPGVNGLEAAQRIRALEQAAGAARTPILALSANVMAHQTAEYLAAGMDGWAAKPINLHSLVAEIARVRAEAAPGEG